MAASSSTFVAGDGAGYYLQMGRWSSRLAKLFLEFVGVAEGDDVLDVGCGTGSLAFTLARKRQVVRVHGIDLSARYIEYCIRHNHDPRLIFQVGDACALGFPDHSFDRVLSLLVLHFVPEPERAIVEMRRVARPGSVVAAAIWDVRGGVVASRIFFDTAAALDARAKEERARNYTRPLTRPEELGKAWRSAGFVEVVETTLSIRMDFSSFDDFWAPYLGRDGPGAEYVATLTDTERAQIQDAVRSAYLDGDGDGPRSYIATAWAVKGLAVA